MAMPKTECGNAICSIAPAAFIQGRLKFANKRQNYYAAQGVEAYSRRQREVARPRTFRPYDLSLRQRTECGPSVPLREIPSFASP